MKNLIRKTVFACLLLALFGFAGLATAQEVAPDECYGGVTETRFGVADPETGEIVEVRLRYLPWWWGTDYLPPGWFILGPTIVPVVWYDATYVGGVFTFGHVHYYPAFDHLRGRYHHHFNSFGHRMRGNFGHHFRKGMANAKGKFPGLKKPPGFQHAGHGTKGHPGVNKPGGHPGGKQPVPPAKNGSPPVKASPPPQKAGPPPAKNSSPGSSGKAAGPPPPKDSGPPPAASGKKLLPPPKSSNLTPGQGRGGVGPTGQPGINRAPGQTSVGAPARGQSPGMGRPGSGMSAPRGGGGQAPRVSAPRGGGGGGGKGGGGGGGGKSQPQQQKKGK